MKKPWVVFPELQRYPPKPVGFPARCHPPQRAPSAAAPQSLTETQRVTHSAHSRHRSHSHRGPGPSTLRFYDSIRARTHIKLVQTKGAYGHPNRTAHPRAGSPAAPRAVWNRPGPAPSPRPHLPGRSRLLAQAGPRKAGAGHGGAQLQEVRRDGAGTTRARRGAPHPVPRRRPRARWQYGAGSAPQNAPRPCRSS